VAAVIEHEGLFFMIEEQTSDGLRINQPAGHLEPNESLLQAVSREALEETAHLFTPTALIGMYLTRNLTAPQMDDPTYLRFAFCGTLGDAQNRPLDDGIVRTLWMSYAELVACADRHRSPLVLRCIDDYLAGQRAPLSLLNTDASIWQHIAATSGVSP
jgi:8-oxo-dGTP pyrophosphatase MutT (NUDIX family)